jgi:hypothetical protein
VRYVGDQTYSWGHRVHLNHELATRLNITQTRRTAILTNLSFRPSSRLSRVGRLRCGGHSGRQFSTIRPCRSNLTAILNLLGIPRPKAIVNLIGVPRPETIFNILGAPRPESIVYLLGAPRPTATCGSCCPRFRLRQTNMLPHPDANSRIWTYVFE